MEMSRSKAKRARKERLMTKRHVAGTMERLWLSPHPSSDAEIPGTRGQGTPDFAGAGRAELPASGIYRNALHTSSSGNNHAS
jgi:hypothetical protein